MNNPNKLNGWEALGFKSYNEFLESDYWKQKRKRIIETKGNFCCKCGSKTNLIVHHLNYDNVGNEKSCDVCILCWDCHEEVHKK